MKTASQRLLLCLVGLYATVHLANAQQSVPENNLRLSVQAVAARIHLGPSPRARFSAVQRFQTFVSPHGKTTITSDNWLGGVGNWSTAALWSTGVPTATSNVFIDNGNPTASTVNLDIAGKANNITINSGDTLHVNNNTSLTVSGNTITNSGTLSLNSIGNATELIIGATNVTLKGGGTLTMSNNAQNLIFGSAVADTLTNQETIQGSGNIGDGQMTLVNSATINANQSVPLTIAANGGTTNTGTLEATLGGTLGFSGTTVTDTTGKINTSGGAISASSTTINGGTVTLAGGALTNSTISGANVTVAGASTLTLSNSAISGAGTLTNSAQIELVGGFGNALGGTVTNAKTGLLKIDNNTGLTLQPGTYSNAGTISLNSIGNATELIIGQANVTLGGGGMITMSNNAQNLIFGSAAADTLTNQETIQGSGNIGDGQMTLVNSGTINANQSVPLTIAANDGTTNTGTLEATLGGTLGFSGTTVTNTTGTINTSGGAISASSSTINGGTLTLAGGSLTNATINGAKVTVAGTSNLTLNNGLINGGSTLNNSGQMEVIGGFGNALGGTITNAAGSLLKIDNNTGLTLQSGTYTNAGTISLNSIGNATELVIGAANITLGGGGTITMSNNAQNLIFGSVAADTLTNQETIQGSGNIGDGQMTLINSGTINANQSAALTIAANDGTTNTGTLEATLGGTLGFSGTTVTNTSGKINTSGGAISASSSTINGGTITLAGGSLTNSTISGANVTVAGVSNLQLNNGSINGAGTLKNSTQMEVIGGFGNSLAGTVTNAAGGLLKIDNNTGLTLQAGTYSNAGTISLNSIGNATELIIGAANITLGGGGTITMSNNSQNLIFGSAAADTLTNQETIQGSGNIGDGQMTLVNSGTINANQSAALTIAANGGTTNTGTLEATLGGTLGFSGTTVTNATGTINTSGGAISASGATINGGTVTLAGGSLTNSTISGANVTVAGVSNLQLNNGSINGTGTLTNGAQMETIGGFGNTLGGTVTNAAGALIKIDNNTGLTVQSGTLTNAGTISLNSIGNATELVFSAASSTLTGGGTITLSNNAQNLIFGSVPANILTNQETIQGSGNIGDGLMGFVNAGTVIANQSVPLIINTSSSGFNNTGTLTVNTGDTLQITANTPFQNFAGTTLTGGTYNVSGTLQFGASGSSLVTNAANITLTGNTSQIINAGGANLLAGFATNAASGSFTLGALRSFTTAGNFTNNGILAVGASDTFTVNGSLTNFSGSTLTGGTYNLTGALQFTNANIVTNAAKITLTGSGSKIMDQSGNNGLLNFATNASTGSFTLGGNQSLTTAGGNFTNAGTFTVSNGSTFTVGGSGFNFTQTGGTATVDGTLTASGAGTLNLNGGMLFGGGTLGYSVVDGATITPGDSLTKTGDLAVTQTYTQKSTGALDIAIGGTAAKQFDQVNVTSTASLNGTLNISLANGFVPAVGSTFDILNASSVSGTFATVTGTSINGSEHFTVTYNGNDVVLTVVAGPAPASVSLLRPSRRPASTSLLPVTSANGIFHPTYSYGSTIHQVGVGHSRGSATVAVPLAVGRTHTFRPLDYSSGTPVPAVLAAGGIGIDTSASGIRSFAQQSAGASNNMAAMDHKRIEVGVDLKELLKTSPKRLLKGLTADPESKNALSLGYVTMTSSH